MTPFDHLKNLHTKKKNWNDFNDEEKIELDTITKSITESLPILLDKKLDLFSSTVNNK